MILFTNGCSWTWGGGLEPHYTTEDERLKLVWPQHLGNLMQVSNVVNLGEGCGSNQRIVRTTFDWLLSQTSETLDNTYAVIQWTEYSRYEYCNQFETNNGYVDDPSSWTRAKIGCLVNSEHDYERAFKRNQLRLETWTYAEGIYSHIAHCETLASLFKKFNVKYAYWHFGNQVYNYPKKYKDYMLANFNWLDEGYCPWDYTRISAQDPHPSLIGHKQIAEIIFNKIKNQI